MFLQLVVVAKIYSEGARRYDNYKKDHHSWIHGRITELLSEAQAKGEAAIADVAFSADAILASFAAPLLAYQRRELGYDLERIIAGVKHVFIDGIRQRALTGDTLPRDADMRVA